jgi:hypothetical protein
MTGWGVKKPNSPNQPNTLKIINILVVDRNKCKNLFATNPPLNTITDNMIWSGDLNGKDFCSVIINFKIFDKINCSKSACGIKNYPEVYIRVHNYRK